MKNFAFAIAMMLGFCVTAGCSPQDRPDAAKPTTSPWDGGALAQIGERAERIIVGADDTDPVACYNDATGIPFNSQFELLYTARTGVRCTATLVTKDGWVVVPDACRSPGARYGTAEVWYQTDTCNGDLISDISEAYSVVEEEYDPKGRGFFLARLSPSPVAAGWASALLGAKPELVVPNEDDELLAISVQLGGAVGELDCYVTSGLLPGPAGGRVTTDCDFADPVGTGGALFFNFNGCVFAPTGGCVPGTGPTSPGAIPGRLAGLYTGRTRNGQNEVIPFSALTGPDGILTPHLTQGNFSK